MDIVLVAASIAASIIIGLPIAASVQRALMKRLFYCEKVEDVSRVLNDAYNE